MDEGLVKIILAVISLLGVIVTSVVVPYLKQKTTKEQRDNVKFWVKVAVTAAEQIYKEKGQGKFKKEYVVEFLNSKGIKITPKQLDILIEAAVFELNKAKAEVVMSTTHHLNPNGF